MKPKRPVGGTFEEWVVWYEACTGDPLRIDRVESVLYEAERGFMTYAKNPENNALYVGKVAGDGSYWHRRAIDLAREMGLSKLMVFSKRDPDAFLRHFGRLGESRIYGTWFESEVDTE